MQEHAEDTVWKTIDPDDLWVMDKLILSRKLKYISGPVGLDVPKPGYYIVRPCVNMIGLGLGAQKIWLESSTMHLPLGHFWCEWFAGRHLSVDYHYGLQTLCVEGTKPDNTFSRWSRWSRTKDYVPRPELIKPLMEKYKWINCEFIGDRLIEVHLRHNEDFNNGINEFVPVWQGESTIPPEGYTYIEYPDVHGRVGAFVK